MMSDADLRAWLDRQADDHAFSGVALVWRDHRPVFSYAGGLAHRGLRVPVTTDTRFAVASVTKLATATAALRLVDRGTLRLDGRVVDLLPPERRPATTDPDLTLHHLLSHTSGIADYHDDADETWASFTSCWDRVPTYHIRRPADMLPLFADLPAVARPGERYRYTDANFLLVGLVLEEVTGRPWDEVVADEVCGPAGMVDTAIAGLDEDPARLAVGYVVSAEPYERWRSNVFSVTANPMPDGGMITTALDLARLVDALIDGRLLSPALLAAMTSPQGPPSTDVEQYGYGCMLAVADGAVVAFGHPGSDPGVAALVSHYPDAATTLAVACNQDRGAGAAVKRIAAEFGLNEPRW
jgi:CubicO group peptidase (beta-lactamase class C family)